MRIWRSSSSSQQLFSDNILESVEAPLPIQSSAQPILPSPPASPPPSPPGLETYSDIENVNKELNLITPESISLVTKVNSGQYDLNKTQIINNLESIQQTTLNSSVAGLAEDDHIADTNVQLNLNAYTGLILDIFKANTCTEDTCIPIDKNDTTLLY